MNHIQNFAPAEYPIGRLLTTNIYATFADGISITTVYGGRLVCRITEKPDPADGPPAVTVRCLAAVSPVPGRIQPDDPRVFTLTTAIVDADGQLWQRERIISIFEIWHAMLDSAVFYRFLDPPSEDPLFRNAENVTRRVLVEPVQTVCDGRESHLVEVIRESERSLGVVTKPQLLYQNPERLIFRFRFKYFAAAIGLVEERASFRIASTNQLSQSSRFIITVHATTDTELIVALNGRDAVIPTEGLQLSNLGILCSRETNLRAAWDQPSWGLPQAGNIDVWHRAIRDAGVEQLVIHALKRSPAIQYEPGAKTP